MIIGVIPARGGSKGVVNKNIREIAGKPLIAWTIESALKSKFIDDFIVSTEDKKITEVAQYYGAKVLSRPFHLGTDEATSSCGQEKRVCVAVALHQNLLSFSSSNREVFAADQRQSIDLNSLIVRHPGPAPPLCRVGVIHTGPKPPI